MKAGKLLPYKFKRFIKQVVYRGDKHICPVCSYRSSKLEPIGHDHPIIMERKIVGAGHRLAGCYRCMADDRERLIYLYLKDYLKVFQKQKHKILHIAPEHSTSKKLYKHLGNSRYKAGDKFMSGYKYPSYVKDMDIMSLPFEENTFDVVICNHVLEHILDDTTAMKEIHRVMKKGGQAILQVPYSHNYPTFEDETITSEKERELLFGQRDHVRIYGYDYFERLESIGFKTKTESLASRIEYAFFDLNYKEEVFIAIK